MKEYLQGEADVLGTLQTDVTTGLSQAEAAARLEKNGPNKLKEAEKTPLWKPARRFLQQLKRRSAAPGPDRVFMT